MVRERMVRGRVIANVRSGEIKQLSLETFLVPSQTNQGDYYTVRHRDDSWKCECPDFTYRDLDCKHIWAVKISLALKARLQTELANEEPRLVTVCKKCGGRVVKDGFKRGKQQFACKVCGRKQVEYESGFRGMKYEPEIVATALDLYFKGTSVRKISEHLQLTNGLGVNYSTVFRWIAKYTELLSEYVQTLKPDLSGKWHFDEMMVKLRGGRQLSKDGKTGYAWLWNAIDAETKFQLASVITMERNVEDARLAFQEARKSANGNKPHTVVTDGLHSYGPAFKWEFYTNYAPQTEWVRAAGLRSIRKNNNTVERLHGTIRERNKVQRGWKIRNTPLAEGQRVYYNFIRPHQSLNNKTPAEAAGIHLGLTGNRWIKLIQMAAGDRKDGIAE
jgi:transposase-like protein